MTEPQPSAVTFHRIPEPNAAAFESLRENVRQRVRYWRRERGLSAAALAEQLAAVGMGDFNGSVIANYESGRRRSLTVEELFAIAAVLRVSPLHLTGVVWSHGDTFDALHTDEHLEPAARDALLTLYALVRRPSRVNTTKTATKAKTSKRTRKAR